MGLFTKLEQDGERTARPSTLGSMLPLDDPRWLELGHRSWSPGQCPGDDPGAPFVPQELSGLLAEPTDFGRLNDLWPYLCSEDTAWPAAVAGQRRWSAALASAGRTGL